MLKKTILKLLFAGALALGLAVLPTSAQPVASGMTGTVTDATGKPVSGATVTVVHTPTNTTFTSVTGTNGRFYFSGMPVGGPYSVNANAAGFNFPPLTEVYTLLGETNDVALVSKEDVVTLEKFVTKASRDELDANATGAGSVLDNRKMGQVPTVGRTFTDMARTNPFVSVRGYPQIEALGMNNRYNSITLDGAKINDSFGLNSSGLFSLFNPFSLDAVEQFSVSLTPYDVRQSGFAGAAINAVSKSGTNEFHGTGYFLFTDANWQGPDLFGPNTGKRTPLKERTYGFTFGGPIIKDKLFFFINWEKFIQDTAPTLPGFTPDAAFVSAVQAKMASLPGAPAAGNFGGSATTRKFDEKRLIKFDWNINRDHRLTVRYSDTKGERPDFGSFSYTSFSQPASIVGQPTSFTNGGTGLDSAYYRLQIKEKVLATQLFSSWTSDFKTELDYSNTKQDSVRAVPLTFPEIRIFNVPGTSTTGQAINSNDAFRLGSENSSMGNELHIKTQTMAASGDYTWTDFTFTAGGDYEKNDYLNLFRQGSYGYFDYNTLADFIADTPYGFARAVVQTGFPTADISKFNRLGIFAQVKWVPMPRLNIILGVRNDFVESPIAPAENLPFKAAFGITNAGTVDGSTTFQPRVSFNYAVDAKRDTQIRGGWGIFLGRNPWVWISNSYGNTGVGRFNVVTPATGLPVPTLLQYLNGSYPASSDPAYKFDPKNPIGTIGTTGTASSINLITPGMQFPTIQRGNIAVDRRLSFLDAVLTLEYIDTKQQEALFVDNMNLRPTTIGADGRQRFAGSATAQPLVTGFANVIRTRNIHEGASQYFSIGLDRPFKGGWAWSASYTHGHATDAQALGSSTANSQWQFNNVFNQNAVEVAKSDYEIHHRVMASLSKQFKYGKGFSTTVTLAYEGRTGQPYSYVYSNDLNGDGFSSQDLVSVPTGPTDAKFDFTGMTAAQQTAYFDYLNSSGLSKYAGSYAPRNSFFTPWQNRLDLRLVQELPAYRNVKFELFADFLNFGSWLSSSFFNYIEEINGSTTNSSQLRTLGTATYTATGLVKPVGLFDATTGAVIFPSTSQIVINNFDSRWRIQGGVRMKF